VNECVSISEAEPVRQGDVFVSHPSGGAREGFVRVVLTADCDIAQSKAGPNLLVLPIISAETYILEHWLQERRQALLERFSERLAEVVNQSHQENSPGAAQFTAEFLMDWARTSSGREIASAVGADQSTKKAIESICAAVRELDQPMAASNVEEAIDRHYELQQRAGILKDAPKRKNRQAEIRNALKNARADVFFLSSVPTFSAIGWLVLLRNVEAIPVERFHRGRADWFNDATGLLRLARLE
jgi:hypothetical protein